MQLGGGNPSPVSQRDFDELIKAMKLGPLKRIAVAVSGGADSMALTLLLQKWCADNKVTLHALSVDHGLRDGSSREAEQVATWLSAKNISHNILTWQGKKPTANIQDEARKARYKLLGHWCSTRHIDHLFLAHHKNDQAETFLMRLLRGSGVDGLSAMEATAPLPIQDAGTMPTLCRPLLSVDKERLLATLKECGQGWIEDPSNQNENFTRIKVRSLLESSEIDGLDSDNLVATAARMGRVRSLLQDLTDKAESDYVIYHPLGYAILKTASLSQLHEEIALRLLRKIIKVTGASAYGPRYVKLLALYQALLREGFSGQTLSGSVIYPLTSDELIFSREPNGIAEPTNITDTKQLLWDNRFIINYDGIDGKIMALDVSLISVQYPDLKEKIFAYFENHKIRDRVLPTLPCIVTVDNNLLLPDILLDAINVVEAMKFSAVLNN